MHIKDVKLRADPKIKHTKVRCLEMPHRRLNTVAVHKGEILKLHKVVDGWAHALNQFDQPVFVSSFTDVEVISDS